MRERSDSELVVDIVLGDSVVSSPLKLGARKVPGVELEFRDYRPTRSAFREMVNAQSFDVCEMALMTALLAHRYGKPISLLPAVVLARFQQSHLVYCPGRSVSAPEDLAGKRVGVRSYTLTTGAWIRGILEQDHGVKPSDIRWVTLEPSHVADYTDPGYVERADDGADLMEMLVAGDLDALIVGTGAKPRDGVSGLFPDGAADAWYARYGVAPINHMICVTDELSRTHPEAVRHIYEAVRDIRAGLDEPAGGKADLLRVGIDACRPAIQMLQDFGVSQGILDRKVPLEELFAEPVRDCL